MMSLMRDGNGNILEFRSLKHFVVDEFGDVASKFNVDLLALVRIQLHIGSKDCQVISEPFHSIQRCIYLI